MGSLIEFYITIMVWVVDRYPTQTMIVMAIMVVVGQGYFAYMLIRGTIDRIA